jgi:hypothetical protein
MINRLKSCSDRLEIDFRFYDWKKILKFGHNLKEHEVKPGTPKSHSKPAIKAKTGPPFYNCLKSFWAWDQLPDDPDISSLWLELPDYREP